MELNNLFRCLNEQHKILGEYLDALLKHQKAIISGDNKKIEDTLKSIGIILFNIGNCETLRQDIVQQISVKYSLKVNSNKLTDFIAEVDLHKLFSTKEIVKIQMSMKNLILEIIKVNDQNKILIKQASAFIKEFIAELTSANRNVLVDRRY
ncbi:MAG TPA: flagellar protein FlgN [Ignavibacteriaceae bacterium]|nr:flagellar protein FlgN [Ignavibacteriaceae bacterium]